ncbi:hypothetical protein ERC79_13805 [Rhodococcus sp. ABRD24]|uniref:hypothetical protein n=1 Tax=Rhodococcus sp. ABRD24 TaxID=2507582 RepID=UPI0010390584|nr:hypothetical protein [Rhodococcus sp. ABRD24]QBJ96904.1 hypothetical protein ERC79_13805 [Rhodococcus sp. ABRD24]
MATPRYRLDNIQLRGVGGASLAIVLVVDIVRDATAQFNRLVPQRANDIDRFRDLRMVAGQHPPGAAHDARTGLAIGALPVGQLAAEVMAGSVEDLLHDGQPPPHPGLFALTPERPP